MPTILLHAASPESPARRRSRRSRRDRSPRVVETRPSLQPERTARRIVNQLPGRVIGQRVGRRAKIRRAAPVDPPLGGVASVPSPVWIFVWRWPLWATACPLPLLAVPAWSRGSRQRHEVLRPPPLPPRTTRGAAALRRQPKRRVLRAHTAAAREWVAHKNHPRPVPP